MSVMQVEIIEICSSMGIYFKVEEHRRQQIIITFQIRSLNLTTEPSFEHWTFSYLTHYGQNQNIFV